MQVLWDIRGKVEQLSSNSESQLGRKKASTAGARRESSLPGTPTPRQAEPQLTYRVTSPRIVAAQTTPLIENQSLQSNGAVENSAEPVIEAKLTPPKFSTGFIVPPQSYQNQGYVAPPPMDVNANNISGLQVMDKNENVTFGGAPAQIIYRGNKMIPLQFLDDKEKEIKALESSNRSLTLKVMRSALETLHV